MQRGRPLDGKVVLAGQPLGGREGLSRGSQVRQAGGPADHLECPARDGPCAAIAGRRERTLGGGTRLVRPAACVGQPGGQHAGPGIVVVRDGCEPGGRDVPAPGGRGHLREDQPHPGLAVGQQPLPERQRAVGVPGAGEHRQQRHLGLPAQPRVVGGQRSGAAEQQVG